MVLLMSSGEQKSSLPVFNSLLNEVCVNLAKQIAWDGEGAKKRLVVEVSKASSIKKARSVARRVVISPLVKTAIYGGNPNWGRIIAAIGSVVRVDWKKISITFSSERGKIKFVESGEIVEKESKVKNVLKGNEIGIKIELGEGKSKATAWGCDLTPEYISINAEYE